MNGRFHESAWFVVNQSLYLDFCPSLVGTCPPQKLNSRGRTCRGKGGGAHVGGLHAERNWSLGILSWKRLVWESLTKVAGCWCLAHKPREWMFSCTSVFVSTHCSYMEPVFVEKVSLPLADFLEVPFKRQWHILIHCTEYVMLQSAASTCCHFPSTATPGLGLFTQLCSPQCCWGIFHSFIHVSLSALCSSLPASVPLYLPASAICPLTCSSYPLLHCAICSASLVAFALFRVHAQIVVIS